jgi:hypothetical protein
LRLQVARAMVGAYFDGPEAPGRPLLPIRDALFEAWPEPDWVWARARIRLR